MDREKHKKQSIKDKGVYSIKTLPLSDETYKRLKNLKITTGYSFNILFKQLIDYYEGSKL
jgi:hypothetical protein